MKKVIRLTESDLVRIVKRVINEQTNVDPNKDKYLQDTIFNIVNYANSIVNSLNQKYPNAKIDTFQTKRVELKGQNPPSVCYEIKWGVNTLSWNNSTTDLDVSAAPKTLISAISAFFDGSDPSQGYGKHIKARRYSSEVISALNAIKPKAVEMMTKNFAAKPALPTPTKKP